MDQGLGTLEEVEAPADECLAAEHADPTNPECVCWLLRMLEAGVLRDARVMEPGPWGN